MGRPVYQLLDDLPVAVLISGFAPQHELASAGYLGRHGGQGPAAPQARRARSHPAGRPVRRLAAPTAPSSRASPRVCPRWSPVPTLPSLTTVDDPWAWHEMPGELPAHGMRRRRRIDVVPGADGSPLVVDAMFRDSHVDDEGTETIVHEYTVLVHVDRPRLPRRSRAHATPQVLALVRVPGGGGERLRGSRAAPSTASAPACAPSSWVRARARTSTTPCRALEDVPALARQSVNGSERLDSGARPGFDPPDDEHRHGHRPTARCSSDAPVTW